MLARVSKKSGSRQSPRTVRVSISLPAADCEDIKKTASSKRVSVAWVVRDAVQDYLRNQTPLLRS